MNGGPLAHQIEEWDAANGTAITGASPHSSEAWFRTSTPNGTIVGWGNEQAQGKVVMQFSSPPHINMDCDFSRGSVTSEGRIALGEWTHVVPTYQENELLVSVNGQLAGSNTKDHAPMAVKSTARFWIGGWYDNYTFAGDLDEVRISQVTRSAEWIPLQDENQKPMQTLVGPLMQTGNVFSLSQESTIVKEGQKAEFIAKAGGAQKLYWISQRDGCEKVVAADRFCFAFDAGRVTSDAKASLQFKAVYADGVKTKDIAITIKETIPEPVFTLKAPAKWDARSTIEVESQIANLAAMQAANGADLKFEWSAEPFAVIKEVAPRKRRLLRSQNSGKLTVTAKVSNGGKPVTQSVENLLMGAKGIAALTFCKVTIEKSVFSERAMKEAQNLRESVPPARPPPWTARPRTRRLRPWLRAPGALSRVLLPCGSK